MPTKNLSRTVIEGGRAGFSRWTRRHSNAQARTWERLESARLLTAAEFDDALYRPRNKVYRAHRDKLAPAERWLRRQIGRPWDAIRSELVARFDSRTTRGRHLLFDHLLNDIHLGTYVHRARVWFNVDAHGILRGRAFGRRLQPKRGS